MPKSLTKLTILFLPALLAAQPAFEAASVKPASPDANGFMTRTLGSQIELRNCSLRQCIETAYGVREYALSGPAWLEADHYDIVAKLPPGRSKAEDINFMLQALLAERFQLKIHNEPREVPGYVLTQAKGGSKLHEAAPDTHPSTSWGRSMVHCRAAGMAVFVEQLSRSLGRPVVDQTSLTGLYDFDLHWTPDDNPPGVAGEASLPGPSLFAAVQEQLGLKLQAQKAPVTLMVVDSVSRVPTGN